MTVAALELNDQSLLIQAEDGALHAEPGFARLTDDGVVTGEAARAVAWREPQHVYNQYWCQLNQAPLPARHRFARHHADIAFAQLRALWQNAGSPESLLLLVPGSFSDEQVSLLLGMAGALPATAACVIDSALAACADAESDTVYVDLQMHDLVLTVCRPGNGTVQVAEQEVFPGLGMAQVQNALARHVSDILIESYRFDPLHSSEAEQSIFDQVPHWLAQLCWERDVSVKLDSGQGEHACILNRDTIRSKVDDRLSSVRAFLDKRSQCELLLSHASGLLRALVAEFSGAEAADQAAATQKCLDRQAKLRIPPEDLYRMRELEQEGSNAAGAGQDEGPMATHLLCGDLALPLDHPISVWITESGLRMSGEYNEDSALALVLSSGSLETLHQEGEVTMPQNALAGGEIRLAGEGLKLIRVEGD